jgi:hypothetical protein
VINYYLPILKNFDKYWPAISNQFPLRYHYYIQYRQYCTLTQGIMVTSATVLIFGLFLLVIFSILKNLFHLNNLQCMFISIFVIFQLSVLRTSWDLHKDMFTLTITFFCLLCVSRIPDLSKKMIGVIVPLSIFSVLADRHDSFLIPKVLVKPL